MSDQLTVYVSIGNSDDKLPQARWSVFWDHVHGAVCHHARQVYGDWLSVASAPWQNSCIAFAIGRDDAPLLKAELRNLAALYGQDSIAWAEAATEFIKPERTEP